MDALEIITKYCIKKNIKYIILIDMYELYNTPDEDGIFRIVKNTVFGSLAKTSSGKNIDYLIKYKNNLNFICNTMEIVEIIKECDTVISDVDCKDCNICYSKSRTTKCNTCSFVICYKCISNLKTDFIRKNLRIDLTKLNIESIVKIYSQVKYNCPACRTPN